MLQLQYTTGFFLGYRSFNATYVPCYLHETNVGKYSICNTYINDRGEKISLWKMNRINNQLYAMLKNFLSAYKTIFVKRQKGSKAPFYAARAHTE